MRTNILDYLERGALLSGPDRIAVVDGDRALSFSGLDQQARALATALLSHLPCRNRPVAVFLPKGLEAVVADLAILFTGNFYTNLDAHSPEQRTKAILDNIRPERILTNRASAPSLISLGIPETSLVLVDESNTLKSEIDHTALRDRMASVIDMDPVCIINTSGSTGVPKSVVLHHRGTIDFMEWAFATLNLDGSERIGSLSPLHFDIYTMELLLCLAKGATLVLIPESLAAFPAKLMEFMGEQAISFIFWVPTIMVNIANQGLLEGSGLSHLHKVFFAGEVFPTKHLNQWRKALPGATFVNLYGPIEIHVDCTWFRVNRDFRDDEALPIGFPCRNTDILVLDENDRECTGEEIGELCVRGSSLALGYWNDSEKTSRAFVQNPLNPWFPERIYRTGDLVHRNARGELLFLGRRDHQIKHFGYRIELLEIEHQVLGISGIRNACVLYNAPRKEITLFYEAGAEIGPGQIRQQLSRFLPKYMLPTVFKKMEVLPRNPNGKIDRNGLRELLSV